MSQSRADTLVAEVLIIYLLIIPTVSVLISVILLVQSFQLKAVLGILLEEIVLMVMDAIGCVFQMQGRLSATVRSNCIVIHWCFLKKLFGLCDHVNELK